MIPGPVVLVEPAQYIGHVLQGVRIRLTDLKQLFDVLPLLVQVVKIMLFIISKRDPVFGVLVCTPHIRGYDPVEKPLAVKILSDFQRQRSALVVDALRQYFAVRKELFDLKPILPDHD